ncbi:MAG: hypothetical protein AB7K86_06245 [Rhodospirillales bacterium]
MLPTIAEPVTMLTDYMIAGECLYFAVALARRPAGRQARSQSCWMLAFLFLGVASVLGGSHHGLANAMSAAASFWMWKLATLAVGPVTFFFLLGTARATLRPHLYRPFAVAVAVELGVYLWWTWGHDDYVYVIADYGSGLVLVLLMQAYAVVKLRSRSGEWMIAGALTSFAAAGLQMSEVSLHQHFNHNDLYHVVQMVALYLFYRGARIMADRNDRPAR